MNYDIFEKNCCKCQMNYYKRHEIHCCKCKIIYNNELNHCCNCKMVYRKKQGHCCNCNFKYDKTYGYCKFCIKHKKLYKDVINELEYYPEVGIKYFEAKNEFYSNV